MTPIETLLPRLKGVRKGANGQYSACCPAHEDKGPSLRLKDLGDRVLIHCNAGCTTRQVMDAMGLPMKALFAASLSSSESAKRAKFHLAAVSAEETQIAVFTVAVAGAMLVEGKHLSCADLGELQKAVWTLDATAPSLRVRAARQKARFMLAFHWQRPDMVA